VSVFVRLYRMTVAAGWYDPRAGFKREYEMHYKVARRGSPRRVRRELARRAIADFQRNVYRLQGTRVPLHKIRAESEREEAAAASQRIIEVYTRSMRRCGKHWSATELPTRTISFTKKRRKRRVAKRKRAQSR
jgi:hypothetical protein